MVAMASKSKRPYSSISQTKEDKIRDVENLYVHKETLSCAQSGCRPCCYKIIVQGTNLLPNQRPEMCPRFTCLPTTCSSKDYLGLYSKDMKILTVGDGDFSFSLSLSRFFNQNNPSSSSSSSPSARIQSNGYITATSHESKEKILSVYPDCFRILEELKELKTVVKHEIDATNSNMMQSLGLFHRIIWNFPCIRKENGADGQNEEMEPNKKLIAGFYEAASKCLLPGGEIHLTHKTKPPFGHWGIVQLAKNSPLLYRGAIVFDRCLYPSYCNKKALSKKSFPIWDSQTYIFTKQPQQDATFKNSNSSITKDENRNEENCSTLNGENNKEDEEDCTLKNIQILVPLNKSIVHAVQEKISNRPHSAPEIRKKQKKIHHKNSTLSKNKHAIS